MITDEQIAQDEKLCEAATPGAWRAEMDFPGSGHGMVIYKASDIDFIARARTALPEYIAEVKRLRTWLTVFAALEKKVEL